MGFVLSGSGQLEAAGLTLSQAIRWSLVGTAARHRDEEALAAEVAGLGADEDDRAGDAVRSSHHGEPGCGEVMSSSCGFPTGSVMNRGETVRCRLAGRPVPASLP